MLGNVTAVIPARRLTCAECGETFFAPRVGRPASRCSAECKRSANARAQREHYRRFVSDRDELAAVRAVLAHAA